MVAHDDALFVTLNATGEVVRIEDGSGGLVESARFAALEDARGIAVMPDGELAVTRWRSPDTHAEYATLAVDGSGRQLHSLAYDPRLPSDTESGGVPSYLDQVVVSPTGREAVFPSLIAGIGEGPFRSGRPLTHETTVRAAISFVDPRNDIENLAERKLFDDRGFASAAVYSSRGDFLFVAMRGSRAVERIDALTSAQAGSILDVGFALNDVALSADDRLLFVDASLSRELVIYDVAASGGLPTEVARVSVVVEEPLAADVLRGKVFFNDSADPRLGRDSYIACAHCHLDGLSDRRTWDFTGRGEGLRNTIDLAGRAGLAHGPLHWSANFDEVQDFEHDIRDAFAGTGLMSDGEFGVGTRAEPLGDTKASISADLDALAAYVTSLAAFAPSPYRNPDGSLPAEAERGRALFASAGCPTCHSGEGLTDSGFDGAAPRLHDVGTLGPGSGRRLGEALAGIDTPTLHGVFDSAPYLHDGSAPTLRAVLVDRNPDDRHGSTSGLSSAEIDDLIAYLRCLDGRVD